MQKHSFRSNTSGTYCNFLGGYFLSGLSRCRLVRDALVHLTPIVDDDYTHPREKSRTTSVAERVKHFLRGGFDGQKEIEVIAVGGITMALNELAEAVDRLDNRD